MYMSMFYVSRGHQATSLLNLSIKVAGASLDMIKLKNVLGRSREIRDWLEIIKGLVSIIVRIIHYFISR